MPKKMGTAPTTKRILFTVILAPDLREGLRLVKERDGISESEQARRAIRQWLTDRNALAPASLKTKATKPRRSNV